MRTRTPAQLPLLLALCVVLAFVTIDSTARMRTVRSMSDAEMTPSHALVRDTSTPSGYAGNQHHIIAPFIGIDGYHWMMQTQVMVRNGDLRVRKAEYDGPPEGRPVHWSGFLHWWLAGVAFVTSAFTGDDVATTIEHVFPWANTLLYCIIVVAVSLIVARRFGAVPGTVFALSTVAVFPAYEVFSVGDLDHHGIVAMCAMLTTLFAVAGGMGWVRSDDLKSIPGDEKSVHQWLLDPTKARRWFIASGIVGGAGLWISAATQVVAIGGVVLAGLIATGILSRKNASASWHTAPEVWRAWGVAGALSSLAFFALEYFPSHMELRLEVNHPLYALAWFGTGDFMTRACRAIQARNAGRDAIWMLLDVLLIAGVPLVMVLVPTSFYLRPGTLLMTLHEDYIIEFRGLLWQMRDWTWTHFNTGMGVLPLILLLPSVAMVAFRKTPAPVRALIIGSTLPAIVFTAMAFRHIRWIGTSMTLWFAALITVAAVLTIGRTGRTQWSYRSVALGVLMALPIVVPPILLADHPARAAALGIPVSLLLIGGFVTAAVIATKGVLKEWTRPRVIAAGALLGFLLLPFPAVTVYKWFVTDFEYPPSLEDMTQSVTRDIARTVRARLGDESGTVISGPTTATLLTYFGGLRSLGTLYWENIDGITQSAKFFGAKPTPDGRTAADNARIIAEANGVRYIVICSWNPMAVEYARLVLGLRAPDAERNKRRGADGQTLMTPEEIADDAATRDVFGREALSGRLPKWLRAVPYQLPAIPELRDSWLWILQVVPDQTEEEAHVRMGQYHLAMNRPQAAMAEFNAALVVHPDYLPALIHSARTQFNAPAHGDFSKTIARINANTRDTSSLTFEDNLYMAVAYQLALDSTRSRSAFTRALAQADDQSIRDLPPDFSGLYFVRLAQQFDMVKARPRAVELAYALLRPDLQAQAGKLTR